MTDVSKQILEKAHGGLKLNPDEQRRFLGTFEERVLGYADLEIANDDKFQKGYVSILESLKNAAIYLEDTATNIGQILALKKN